MVSTKLLWELIEKLSMMMYVPILGEWKSINELIYINVGVLAGAIIATNIVFLWYGHG